MKEKSISKMIKNILFTLAVFMLILLLTPTTTYAASTNTLTVTTKDTRLKNNKMTLGKKDKAQLTVKYGNKNVTSKAIYKSSNKKVATINKKGRIVAKKNGTTIITINYSGTHMLDLGIVRLKIKEKARPQKIKLTVHKHTWKKYMVKENWKLGVVVLRCGYQGGRFYYGAKNQPYISRGSYVLIGQYTTDGYKILTSGEAWDKLDHLTDHLKASVDPELYAKLPKGCRDVIDEFEAREDGEAIEGDHWITTEEKMVKHAHGYHCSCGVKKYTNSCNWKKRSFFIQ